MPQEWGPRSTHKYKGGFRLEVDQSWTPLEKLSDVDDKTKWAHRLLDKSSGSEQNSIMIGELNMGDSGRQSEPMS